MNSPRVDQSIGGVQQEFISIVASSIPCLWDSCVSIKNNITLAVTPVLIDLKEIFRKAVYGNTIVPKCEPPKAEGKVSLLQPFLPPVPLTANHQKDTAKYDLSLLPSVPTNADPRINEHLFSALLFGSFVPVEDLFQYFSDTAPSLNQNAFKAAQNKENQVEKIIQEKDKNKLLQLAHEFAEQVSLIDAENPLFLHGTIAKRSSNKNPALELLTKAAGLEEGDDFNTWKAGFLKELCATVTSSLAEATHIEEALSKAFNSLFQNLPFPKVWNEAIKKSLQEDIKELVIGPPNQEIHSHGEALWNSLLEHGLEKTITTSLEKIMQQASEIIARSGEQIISSATESLPPLGLDILSLSGFLDHNEKVWLEIKKQPDGKFQVILYGRETFVYSDIESSSLNKEFFYQFLCYHALPRWDSNVSYSFEDLTSGLMPSLHKEPEAPNDCTTPLQGSDQSPFNAYLRFHLNLSEVEFQKFRFEARQKAFLQMWSHVKAKEPEIYLDTALIALLQRAADTLAEEGLSLYQKGQITADAMKQLAATVVDADRIIKAKRKKAEQNKAAESVFLPAEVELMVRKTLDQVGISAEHVAALRDICMEVFGPTIEKSLDILLKEIIHESVEKKALSPPPPSWKEVFSIKYLKSELSKISSMRISPLHIYRFYVRYLQKFLQEIGYLVSTLLWAHAAVALLPFPMVGAGALFALCLLSRAVATQDVAHLIPQNILSFFGITQEDLKKYLNTIAIPFRIYRELSNYINKKITRFVLKKAIKAFISPELIQSITSMQQKLNRQGELSYDLNTGCTYTTTSLALPLECPSLEQSRTSSGQVEFVPKMTPITGQTIADTLTSWEQEYKKMAALAPGYAAFYLNLQIGRLPIPGASNFWNDVPEKRAVLEKIHLLFLDLANETAHVFQTEESYISIYALYAITDFLARQCPESRLELTGTPNGCDFINWLQNPSREITKPESYQQAEEICNYFGFDIKKRYSPEEIKEKRKGCSFVYRGNSWDVRGLTWWGDSWVFKLEGSGLELRAWPSEQQKEAYKAFLKDPEIKARLDLFVKDKSDQEKLFILFQDPSIALFKSEYISEGLSQEEAKKLLQSVEPSPLHPNPRGGLLPRSFSLVRSSLLIATNLLMGNRPEKPLSPEGGWELVHTAPPPPTTRLEKTMAAVAKIHHTCTRHVFRDFTSNSNVPLAPLLYMRGGNTYNYSSSLNTKAPLSLSFTGAFDSLISPGEKSQDQAVRETATRPLTQQENALFHMITSSKVDELMRAFGYFQEHYKSLSDENNRFFLSAFVHQIGVLKAQLQENKDAVMSLGSFFKKSLDYYYAQRNYDCCFFLCILGQQIKEFCTFYAPETKLSFPDFRAFLRETIPSNLSSGEHAILDKSLCALIDTYPVRFPESVTEHERKQILFDLCRKYASRIPDAQQRPKNQGQFWFYTSVMETDLNNDPHLRKKIIETIFHDAQICLPLTPQDEWQGTYPVFTCRNFSFDFASKAETSSFTQFAFQALGEAPGVGIPLSKTLVHFSQKNIFVEQTLHGFKITTPYQGKVFQYVKKVEKTSFWKEETEADTFDVLSIDENKVRTTSKAKKEGQSIKILFSDKTVGGKTLRKISSDHTSLSLLSWFQPLDKIDLYIDPERPEKVARIEFPDISSLAFSVEGNEAMSEGSFPGFFIAKEQYHPSLQSFSNYLLLQNENHEKKVILLPQSTLTLVGTFVMKQFAHLSTSPFIENMLRTILNKNKSAAFTYSLDKDGKLCSSDPESLAYLILHYFTHGDLSSAKKYLEVFEDLGKRVPYSAETCALLEILNLPLLLSQDRLATAIALRLSAIHMENKLLQKVPVIEPFSFSLSQLEYFLIQKKYNEYLKTIDSNPFLSEFQELFLLKRLETFNQAAIGQFSANFDLALRKLIKYLGADTFASHLFLLPKIFERQALLRKKHPEGNSAALIAENVLYHSLKELPANLSPGFNVTSLLPSNPSSPSFLQKIARTFKKFLSNPYSGFLNVDENIDIPPFINQTKYDLAILETLPVDLWDLTPENIRIYFLLYYRLATNILPPSWKGNLAKEKIFREKRAPLIKNLNLLHGTYKAFPGKLLHILQKACQQYRLAKFPSPDKFEELLEGNKLVAEIMAQLGTPLINKDVPRPTEKQFWESMKKLRELRKKHKFDSSPCPQQIHRLFLDAWETCKTTEAANFFFSKSAVAFLGSACAPFGMIVAQNTLLHATGLGPLIHGYRWICRGLRLFRVIKDSLPGKVEALPPPAPHSLPTHLSEALKVRDTQLTNLFTSFFDAYFVEEKETSARAEPKELPDLHEDASVLPVKRELEKLRQSVVDYYNRPQEPGSKIRLKDGVKEEELFQQVTLLQKGFQERIALEQKAILKLSRFPKKPRTEGSFQEDITSRRQKQNPVTFEEISTAFARGELSTLVEQGRIPREAQTVLEERFFLLLVLTSRFHFLFSQTLSAASLGQALKRTRVFGFEGTPEPLLRAKLLFESAMHVLLWKRPMEQLEKMLLNKDQKAVLEALMGWGKSFCLIPIASAVEADRSQLVINIWPTPVAATNIQGIASQVKEAFGGTANALHCNRNFLPDVWGLIQVMQRAIARGEQINATQEDIKALELLWIENGLYSIPGGTKEFEALKTILALIRTKGKAIIDEVHKLFDPQTNELNYPLGHKKHVAKEYVQLISKVLLLLVEMPEIQDLVHLKAKNPTTVDEALFREKVAPLLLAQVAKFPELEIPQEHQAEFVRYALGTTEGIPSFVKASKHRSCLGLVKGLINPLFPIILQVIPNVGYARSKNPATGEFARPSEGNENPEERNTIRNPFEALIKSGILALQKRLTDEQIKTLLSKFKEKAIQESGKRAIHPSETSFAKRFKKITGHDLFALEENEATLEQCKENDKLTLVYFEWVIAQQILFFPENLCSDSHNFESMFPSSQAFTGTPSNDGCFPEGTKFHLDPGTLGESIDVLLTKCSDRKSFVTQHGTSPKELLHGLLNQFFQEGSKATALIDRGPLLNGMATKEVAHEIMAFVEKKRPSIKGVVYYEKGEQFILEKGAFKGTALKESKVQENERITYFDEPHTFAADIPQPDDAIGIISIGEHTTLEQLVQALWRLRKLKRGRQQPIFVMSEKVQSLLPENFSIHDIFYFCAKNQGVSLANLNYLADRSKIHNVTRRALLDRALFTSSTTESLNILKEFRDIFVTQIEEDPFILYGQIDRMVSPEEVFTHLRKSLSKRIEKYRLLSTDEKNEIKQSAEAIGHGFYPEKVHVYQVNKDIDAQLLDDLGRSMEIAQNQTQEQEQEQEQQLQEEQTVNQQNALDTTRESPPPFIDWPKDFSPTRSTDWVKEPPVPLFSVHEVLQDSRQKALKKVAPLFVGSLRATANFFQLTDTGIWARKVSPFGPFQKPSFEVLVVQNDHERTIILVDQKEADFFRDKLREDRLSKDTSPIKIGLYDIKNRTFAATGKNGFKDEELGSAFYRDITKLCFLDGQVTYTDEEQKDLVSWLSHEDPFALQKAFDEIHSARGTEPLVDSDISYVFVEAIRLFSLNGHRSPLPEQDPITPTTPQSHVWEKTLADRFCPLVSLAKHVLPAG